MMEFVKGDMFDAPADMRVNTVNCVGVMGAGVALAFKKRYPDMYKAYQRDCRAGLVRPGQMHIWQSLTGDRVINFPTKRDWREPSRYEDIEAGLDDLRSYLKEMGSVKVALPALGCGNGGLDWSRVAAMIRDKLDGLDAHIMVFEPDASREAARIAAHPTDDERREAEELGFTLIEPDNFSGISSSVPYFLMGSRELLSRKWIALLPSRDPGDREFQALRAIAGELGRTDRDKVVALLYTKAVSENIAELFLREGINTVLLLPFGVLTRKAIAKRYAIYDSGSALLLSSAPATAKWSRQLLSETMEMLRMHAAAVLLSDPEPEWLIKKALAKWAEKPISYIRYEATSSYAHEALRSVGGRPIGRRAEDGAPNIDYLVGAHGKGEEREPRAALESVPRQESAISALNCEDAPDSLTIEWGLLSEVSRRGLLEFLAQAEAPDMTVTVKLPSALTKADRRRLAMLSLVKERR